MKGQETLTAELRIVTPVFCAGADQNGPSEIRPFSLRGALRWWYRAIDGDFFAKEPLIFGATAGGGKASPISLQLGSWVATQSSLKNQLRPENAKTSGAAYLGYTFYLSKNDRKAILPTDDLVPLRLKWNWKPTLERDREYFRRAWAAALWLFGHLGGLGTRARRGYGTLALEHWDGWEECKLLGVANGAKTPEEWKARFEGSWKQIRRWFQAPTDARHHYLGQDVKIYLWKNGYADWKTALDAVGMTLQNFRRAPDWHKPELLAAFGLPIRFRNHPAGFAQPEKHNRAASPLQIRVVRIASAYHPLVWRAQGALVPEDKLTLKYEGNHRGQPPSDWDRALKAFLNSIQQHCIP